MRYLKPYKKFQENAAASASSSAGMGAVSAAQPGGLAGTTGTSGSGDLGFTFKKEKRKKGDPTEVSDMRDLEPAEGITKVGEIKESRDPSYDAGTRSKIYACIVELFDLDFELNGIDYKIGDLARETETQYFEGEISENEELKISLRKQINKIWTGNMLVKCKFDVDGITSKRVSTLRGQGPEMDKVEKELFDLVEEISAKIINILDYRFGQFSIMWGVSGSAMPYNSDRTINIDIDFILNNNASMLPFWT